MTKRAKVKSLRAVTVAIAVLAGVGTVAPSAEAGQPWSCVCQGKPKRFIASTKACEWRLPRNKPLVNKPGALRLLSACTSNEFEAWNRKACKQEGCRPPRWMKKSALDVNNANRDL
jgi:hypothetical protein